MGRGLHFISLFCGAGGLDLGFEEAGFRPMVAYDIAPAAVCTYNHNRVDSVARVADLGRITAQRIVRDIEELGGQWRPMGVVGGPPCQYFSVGNRAERREDDVRRRLPIRYAALLRNLNEEYNLHFFILENVSGLAKPSHREDFECIIEMFEGAGFAVFSDILDAHDFGVPQHRQRLFLLGWNRELYPGARYGFPVGQPSGLTVRDAIAGLQEPRLWARNQDSDEFPEHPNHWTMRPVSDKFGHSPPHGMRRGTRSFRRLAWDRPSYTVAYGHNEIHVHPEGHRRLSVYEAMLIQGFPRTRDGYRLFGNLSEQVTLISDAVPPPLAAALAGSILQFMERYDQGGPDT